MVLLGKRGWKWSTPVYEREFSRDHWKLTAVGQCDIVESRCEVPVTAMRAKS
jgi:hypothetical protein